jgi:hypothetical protein
LLSHFPSFLQRDRSSGFVELDLRPTQQVLQNRIALQSSDVPSNILINLGRAVLITWTREESSFPMIIMRPCFKGTGNDLAALARISEVARQGCLLPGSEHIAGATFEG